MTKVKNTISKFYPIEADWEQLGEKYREKIPAGVRIYGEKVDKVYNVIKYSNGVLLPENLSGNITLEISYNCRFCLPVENSTIICQVKGIHQELIIAKNGPITIFIRRNNIKFVEIDATNMKNKATTVK